MAEKRVPIIYRAKGEEERKKRILLSTSVTEVFEGSRKLFSLTGNVCLKAKIDNEEEYDIESQDDYDEFMQDIQTLIVYPKVVQPNDKLVCIDGEDFHLDKLPSNTSNLVWKERCRLIYEQGLAIPAMVTEFDKVKDFLYIAFYGTRNFMDIHLMIQHIGFDVAKLSEKSWGILVSFNSKCGLILEKLQGAFSYLYDGSSKMAMLNFTDLAVISVEMISKSSELKKMFDAGIEKTRDALVSTQTERSKQEEMLEAEKRNLKATKEKRDITTSELAATEELIGYLSDEEERGERQNMDQRKQKKEAILRKSNKELKTQDEKKYRLEQTLQALHKAISGLKGLSNTMLKSGQVFELLSEEVNGMARRCKALKDKVATSAEHDKVDENMWKSVPFKMEAIKCQAKWVALERIFSSHVGEMKEVNKSVQTFLCENPTPEEAEQKMGKIWEYSERQLQLTREIDVDDQQEESLPAVPQQSLPAVPQQSLPAVPQQCLPAVLQHLITDTKTQAQSQETDTIHNADEVTYLPKSGKQESPRVRPIITEIVNEKSREGADERTEDTEGACGGITSSQSPNYTDQLDLNFIQLEKSSQGQNLFETLYHVQTDREIRNKRGDSKSPPVQMPSCQERFRGWFRGCDGANLYVNNLDPNIDKDRLRREFASFGHVTSVRVGRKKGFSEGYGFVCYSSPEEAARAIHGMNGQTIENKAIYVEIHDSKRKESLRKLQEGNFQPGEGENLYVNNLDINIDEKRLSQEFARFGDITSVTIRRRPDGVSKGFGFVCYKSPHQAARAIQMMNGRFIEGKALYVDLHQPRQRERQQEQFQSSEGANLYISNLDINVDEDCLRQEFMTFGIITSVTVWRGHDGLSQGFGFVCYMSPAEAVKAINHMNGKMIGTKQVSVDLAQLKEGRNLYINNLASHIDDVRLRREFEPFGHITSVLVKRDAYGYSHGYGFICYSNPEEAARAIKGMNKKILENMQLYVDLAKQKEGRNVFVNNLADNIDDERLHQEFEPFGTIISAKIKRTDEGYSRGMGLVRFSTAQEALNAITEMDGKIMENKQLYVDLAPQKVGRRNVFVNNLASHIDDNFFNKEFARFGTITSAKVKTDQEGNSRGFGFVCYSSPEEAAAAVTEMNEAVLENLVLYVALAEPPQRWD